MAATEKVRVIIVDDISETRENIRKLLQFENDVEVVGTAKTGREGLELSKNVKPDVVLMDINMPDMDGITATESIRKSVPYTQIIILSVQSDPNYMRRAMVAGAHDFLTKPPSVDDLTAAIRRAGVKAREERTKSAQVFPAPAAGGAAAASGTVAAAGAPFGKVITVYSPKGGTGCTTIATNLAISLHSDEAAAVLVDGKLRFGDVAIFLNEQGKNSVVDLAARANELDPEIVDGVLIKHAASGIKFLPAPHRPEEADNVNGDQMSKILRFLCRMYAYVVVDACSELSDTTLSIIDASDLVVLVTTQDIPSLKNSRLFLNLADVMGLDRKRVIFIMNRFDRRLGVLPERISETFKQEVVTTIPLEEKVIVPSVNKGIPFIIANKTQPIGKQFYTLTDAVRQRLAQMDLQEDPKAKAPPRAGIAVKKK